MILEMPINIFTVKVIFTNNYSEYKKLCREYSEEPVPREEILGITHFAEDILIGVFDKSIATAAHEATHAAVYICDLVGVKIGYENDETLACLVGHIVEEIIKTGKLK